MCVVCGPRRCHVNCQCVNRHLYRRWWVASPYQLRDVRCRRSPLAMHRQTLPMNVVVVVVVVVMAVEESTIP